MILYIRAEEVFQKSIGEDLCLLKNKDKFVYKQNKTAGFLWQFLKTKHSSKELATALSKKYQIPLSEADEDVKNFLNYYLKEKLIKKISE